MKDLAKIARPYALAAFEYAKEHHQFEAWSQMLSTMATFLQQPELLQLLKNPAYSVQQQTELFLNLKPDLLDMARQNFVKLLAENHRLPILPIIAQLFAKLRADSEKTQKVCVKSAVPLPEKYLQKIKTLLENKFRRTVELHCQVDSGLIGGLYIQAGDYVIDGSVKGQLSRMQKIVTQ